MFPSKISPSSGNLFRAFRLKWISRSCSSIGHSSNGPSPAKGKTNKTKSSDGRPDFRHFLRQSASATAQSTNVAGKSVHYIDQDQYSGHGRKVFYETHGCQMNKSDMEIVRSVLDSAGFSEAPNLNEADIVLVITCALRESAENKVRRRVDSLRHHPRPKEKQPLTIGILGCMAERLKEKLLEEDLSVSLVAGPDSYRDLPRLLASTRLGLPAVNVLLSLEETYADVIPVRRDPSSVTAFVSIMRGCDNMCTYCIVPFTRGRERSRPIDSILNQVRLLRDQGVKEVVLLGQNVNSYRDLSQSSHFGTADRQTEMAPIYGFQTVYRPRVGGRRFVDLLEKVSDVDPNLRIRFTSPHPKDFPDEVLELIAERKNICRQLHLPAQTGNNALLEAMGRGYSRESYLDLVHKVREFLGPDVCLTSDFIAGFCGESEAAHGDTISLIREVGYDFCYCYPYSMREKTRAHRRLKDDVPEEEKKRRALELLRVFREEAHLLHQQQIGTEQLVLVEGTSKRSNDAMAGRNDGGTKVIVPNITTPSADAAVGPRLLSVGDYVGVRITDASSQVLIGTPLRLTSLENFVPESAIDSSRRRGSVPF